MALPFSPLALALRHSFRAFSCLGGTSWPPPSCPVPWRCQMGWSKAARPQARFCPLLYSSQAPGEPGRRPGRAADGELGGGAARLPVRTDGGLGRGPELAHLLLPLQGLFSAPPADLGWVHFKSLWMFRAWRLGAGVPAQFPLGVSQPLLAGLSQCWRGPWGSPD